MIQQTYRKVKVRVYCCCDGCSNLRPLPAVRDIHAAPEETTAENFSSTPAIPRVLRGTRIPLFDLILLLLQDIHYLKVCLLFNINNWVKSIDSIKGLYCILSCTLLHIWINYTDNKKDMFYFNFTLYMDEVHRQ